MIPSCSHTGVPIHFHSSTTSGSASLIKARSWPSILPRQSPSSLIRASMRRDGDSAFCEPLFDDADFGAAVFGAALFFTLDLLFNDALFFMRASPLKAFPLRLEANAQARRS